jgi:5'-methylthioadenosine/S-adenosylhomocysteine nucleosidase
MKKVVLLAAMGSEVAPLERLLPGITILGTGVGKVAAAMNTQRAILEHRPDALVFVGVAGGLGNIPHLGVVIAKDAVQWDVDITAINGGEVGTLNDGQRFLPLEPHGSELALRAAQNLGYECKLGRVASGDSFVADPKKSAWILETFKADAVEMEGAAALQVADQNKVPMVLIRVISDGAGDDAPMSFTDFLGAAAERAAQVVAAFLPQWLESLEN